MARSAKVAASGTTLVVTLRVGAASGQASAFEAIERRYPADALIHRAGGGVDPKPLGPGLHFRNPLLSAIEEYPVFMQTLVLTRETTEEDER